MDLVTYCSTWIFHIFISFVKVMKDHALSVESHFVLFYKERWFNTVTYAVTVPVAVIHSCTWLTDNLVLKVFPEEYQRTSSGITNLMWISVKCQLLFLIVKQYSYTERERERLRRQCLLKWQFSDNLCAARPGK